MNSGSLRVKLVWAGLGLAVVAGGVLVYGWQALRRVDPVPSSNTNLPAREVYANLYDAAFRADTGQGSVLMTATLLLPPTIEALGDDTTRSDVEDALYRAVRDLSANQVAFFITTDSRIGSLTEEQITSELTLTSQPVKTWRFMDWQSVITLQGIAATNSGIIPQTGVVIFETDETIDWANLTELVLTKQNLADVAQRRFVWTEPALLLSVQDE